MSQMLWRALRAKVLARRGATLEAESLAREALEVAGKTDSIDVRGDVAMDLSEVLRVAGRESEARKAIGDALELYEQKGNVVSAKRARDLLAIL